MMDEDKLTPMQNGDDTEFYKQVADFLAAARNYAKRQLDGTIALTYFEIGRMIVEREQGGQKRAQYGAKLIKGLSEYLTEQYGRGFSIVNLKSIRKFYQVYAPSIGQSLTALSEKSDSMNSGLDEIQKQQSRTAKSDNTEKSYSLISLFDANAQKGQSLTALFKLSWTHYQILMRVDNEAARNFYEIEAASGQWTVRQLQRQVGSSLYERLALSRDKDKVLSLANKGQTIESPRDIFKKPYVLEFTGLEERSEYSETELEQALMDNLQKFLLELGKGFLFEARQKRFTFDEKSFFVDIVFYNRLLQCYVIIDLKIDELMHQDLGQMMMYVNYFDRYMKQDFEKPTIGILLCGKKSDNIVELTLPEDSNIYASEYSLYLPDKSLLQRKVAEWIKEFEDEQELRKLAKDGDGE
ncbi:MAG: PDDEXK nuclease domain-containing protein [Oscillospiraceae bacterium]|jgi:predicted nuclease of restriction endonuclease-like (RecB) superfamily|nr:PDDEXK nuclease domain-containing protein [Oscillospiraceae bacterium]